MDGVLRTYQLDAPTIKIPLQNCSATRDVDMGGGGARGATAPAPWGQFLPLKKEAKFSKNGQNWSIRPPLPVEGVSMYVPGCNHFLSHHLSFDLINIYSEYLSFALLFCSITLYTSLTTPHI